MQFLLKIIKYIHNHLKSDCMENKALFQNKYKIESTRLKCWDYSNPGFYFVTICTKNRENIFGEIVNKKIILNKFGYIIKHCWHNLPNHYKNCILDSFIIMPNHFHGIIQITGAVRDVFVETIHESSLREPHQRVRHESSQQYKSPTYNYKIQCRKMLLPKIIGRFKMQSSKIINQNNLDGIFRWQLRFYDHIIRTQESLWNIREYIKNNPTNWINDRNFKK